MYVIAGKYLLSSVSQSGCRNHSPVVAVLKISFWLEMELQRIRTGYLGPSPPRFSAPSIPISLSNPFLSKNSLSALRLSISRRSPPISKSVSVSAAAAEAEKKDRLPAELKITEIEEPNSRVRLSVEVPPIVCQDCYGRVLDEFSKQTKVPGFRPGKKIPENILLNYVGKQLVQKATIEAILRRTLPHAMSSVEGRALKDSVQFATKYSEMEGVFSPQDFLRYDVVVDVAPQVKWVSENAYKNLKVVVEIDNDITVEKAAEAELRWRHKALGALRIVRDRGLQVGDVAVLDIFATSITKDNSDGENIPSAEKKGFNLDTEEDDYLIPGFLNSIIGIQQGETKSFPLQFPETWKQENLRGVHAQFTVECKELFYRDLPEFNDSLADKLLSGCTTLSQVRELILQRCREVEQAAREQATDNAILDQLCQLIEVDIPWSLIEEQGRQLYGARLLELQASTKLDEKQLASLSSEKAVNEFLEKQKEDITNTIKQMLAVGEIYKRESLQYSTEELAKELENSVAEFKRHNQKYDEERIRERVQDILEGAEVLEWLREHADVQYITR